MSSSLSQATLASCTQLGSWLKWLAGGHSLGGAFALLMACMARVRMDFDPTAIRCYAFGAPPVLSLSEKTSAQNVMSVRTLHCGAEYSDL